MVGKDEQTMHDFIALYLRNHVNHLSVSKEMTGTIRIWFGPLEAMPLSELTPVQIEEWFHQIGGKSPMMANKCLSILRTMFEKARDWRLFVGDNPAQRVKKYKSKSRKRFIQPSEMPNLMKHLAREDEQTQVYFLLCLFVGCRKTEALTLRWADLDMEQGIWHKTHTKTGRSQTVPIPLALLQRIDALPRKNPYVFATCAGHWSRSYAFNRWNDLHTAAGLPDVTIHDLRRNCASWMACSGENLAIINNVLNHSGLAHMAIYARLNVSPVARALEANSVRMMGASNLREVI
jgi:integrase